MNFETISAADFQARYGPGAPPVVLERGKQTKAVARKRPEEAFQAQVIALAETLGWRVYHTRNSRGSVAGFPDLILLRGERGIAAELKASGKRPTPEQVEWLLAFGSAGFEQRLWHPEDMPFIADVLR